MSKKDKIISLALKGHYKAEIARIVGVSREYVGKVLEKEGIKINSKYDNMRTALIESGMLGKAADTEVAKKLGVAAAYVRRVRTEMGIEKYQKPIGCSKCKTAPFSGGLCKACYERKRRRRGK